ncbi:hypothetical protein [Bradyrhizobium sp. JR3.5]
MIRSEAVEILARRLNINAGRAAALAQRAAESGFLPRARGRYVPRLDGRDLARLFLAVVADRGLGNAADSVVKFENLENEHGLMLGDVLRNILGFRTLPIAYASGGLIVRLDPAGATLVAADTKMHFGSGVPEEASSKSISIPGATLAAIAYEFSGGYTATEADHYVDHIVARLIGVRHAA